jgi:3-hydroxybutyryl-CoA dehydrogenase
MVGSERLGIVGSGTIACGLATAAARQGELTLWARSDASAERAERLVAKACAKIDGLRLGRVRIATGLDGIEDYTFVVEAVAEEAAVKQQVLGEVAGRLADGAVLGTTTSSLSVASLASASGRAERFVGFHVFNPVPRMELVELAFPPDASPDTRARARALCELLDKRAVEVPDSAGFVVNRLLFPYLFDAVRFADEAAMAPEDVDACMTLGAGHPMGPLALLDFVGLDVAAAIGRSLGVAVPDAIVRLVAEGACGRKAGRGFYQYD